MSRKKIELQDHTVHKQLFGTNSAMQVTDSSLMEMTIASEAEVISQEIEKFTDKKPHILECSAGVGGNTINFMKAGFRCTAIEHNHATYECLANNVAAAAREFGCEPATMIHGDCYAELKKLANNDATHDVDCVFADPPWGGAHYKKTDALKLFYGDHSIEEIANIAARICPYFVLKCPMNIVSTYLDPRAMGYAAVHQLIFRSQKGRPVYQIIFYAHEPITHHMRIEFVREPFNYRQIKYYGGEQPSGLAAVLLILLLYVFQCVWCMFSNAREKHTSVYMQSGISLWGFVPVHNQCNDVTAPSY